MIEHIDGPNRLIYLDASTVNASIHPIDIYKAVRELRKTDEGLRTYKSFIRADGNVYKGGGKYTERYVTLLDGTRIVPYDISHVLSITGTLITDDGAEGVYCFHRLPLTVGVQVDIQYIPPQVEIITIQAGSGLDFTQNEMLEEIHSGAVRMVHVDPNNIVSGDGSPSNPFQSMSFAVGYASVKGILKIHVHSNCVLDVDVNGYEIVGATQPLIDLNGFNVGNTDFHNCQVTGSSAGSATYRECNIMHGTTGINGIYHSCALSGDVTVENGGYVIFSNSFSGIAGSSRPSISLNDSDTAQVAVRAFSGGISIKDMVVGCAVTVGITDGECRFESTCVGGDVHVRGVGFYENLGSVAVNDRAFVVRTSGGLTQEQHDKLMDTSTTVDTVVASQL